MPFIGPYVHFGFMPDSAWHFTADRLYLIILPAVATILGGLMLMFAANRVVGMAGGWLAALAGLWFVVGNSIAALWGGSAGTPIGASLGHRLTESLSGFTGLGTVITFLAAMALGRFAVVGVRDARRAERAAAAGGGAATAREGERAPRQGRAPEWERTGEGRGATRSAVPAHGRAGRGGGEHERPDQG
ncbi:hypothetical protein [Actinomadura atramentaria]|uniref:hypothetical protein n=1 Tax=Actinomadura atramentaria TaxID=1990 RepID=UPI00037D88FD|nr:hypothetical protein [Actinomadura atramentaria]